MRRSIVKIAAFEILRSGSFLWLLAAMVALSLVAMIVPVRFREPTAFARESLGAIHVLFGVLFAVVFGSRSLTDRGFVFDGRRLGPLPVGGIELVHWHFLGQVAVLGLGHLGLLLAQSAASPLIPVMHTSAALDSGHFALLTSSTAYTYIHSACFCALARLLTALLPQAPMMLTLFVLLISTHFLGRLVQAPPGDSFFSLPAWKLALAASTPALDIVQPDLEEGVGLGSIVYAGLLIVAANFLAGWLLESLRGALASLDRGASKT